MSDDAATLADVRLAALGLTPSHEELAALNAMAALIVGGLQLLHAVELDDDTGPAVRFSVSPPDG